MTKRAGMTEGAGMTNDAAVNTANIGRFAGGMRYNIRVFVVLPILAFWRMD
ncbi:MAG: hypothetical protein ACR2P4_02695 [Gammaproteobacteria bacterium]